MPAGIRDRISSITKKYKEKQALKYKTKKELDAIYEEAKAKQMKKEVAKRAGEAAKKESLRIYPRQSPIGRVVGELQEINRVAKAADPNRNPFAPYRVEVKKTKKKKKGKSKSKRKTMRNYPPPSDGLLYGYGHPAERNATTINNDPFEVEGKKWLDAM